MVSAKEERAADSSGCLEKSFFNFGTNQTILKKRNALTYIRGKRIQFMLFAIVFGVTIEIIIAVVFTVVVIVFVTVLVPDAVVAVSSSCLKSPKISSKSRVNTHKTKQDERKTDFHG